MRRSSGARPHRVYIARMDAAVRFGALLAFSLAELMCFVAVFHDRTLTGMVTWMKLVAANIVAVVTFAARRCCDCLCA